MTRRQQRWWWATARAERFEKKDPYGFMWREWQAELYADLMDVKYGVQDTPPPPYKPSAPPQPDYPGRGLRVQWLFDLAAGCEGPEPGDYRPQELRDAQESPPDL